MSDASPNSPSPLAPHPPGPTSNDLASPAHSGYVKVASRFLLILGALTILFNAIFLFRARDNVRAEIEAKFGKTEGNLQQIEDDAVHQVALTYSAHIALGVLFVILSVLVKQFPVAATVLSLMLYIGATIAFASLDPTTLSMEAVKLAFVIPLVWVIQTLADWRAGGQDA